MNLLFRHLPIPVILLASLISPLLAGENRLENPGLEDGPDGWKIFISEADSDKEAAMTISQKAAHSGSSGVEMSCPQPIRYSVTPYHNGGNKIQPGERYKVTAWVRAGADFELRPKTPGFYIRVTLHSSPGEDVPGGHLYFGLQNQATRGNPALLGSIDVPKTWTKITGTFEVPEETAQMHLNIFVNDGSGSIYIDDVSLERVPDNTPLTPLTE